MSFDDVLKSFEKNDTKINIEQDAEKEILLNNEALFQLPFLSIVVLLLSKNRKKPKVDSIGQLVGECLELSIKGFKGSSQHLGWSANLRIRTIIALNFLEISKLIFIDKKSQTVRITELGKKIIDYALSLETDLSYTLNLINRKYRDINKEKKIELELYEIS
ncbi:hypothetical protein [Malaciobacter marinus]|jgi:hypothetical protein|uniref:hypothetical protein n=1 Tax=Malaciobacter marinus TaxID=505249 RepID=UPI0009A78F35|nr:hypothetical protein [Malaciobacter marinus]SKB52582.1 hypothetical protein SAMN06295997_11730 [Malaciobacter marinus]